MRRLIPLIALAFAACDAPMEELWPRQNFAFDRDGRTYDVRVQYDPIEFGYYARVSWIGGKLTFQDRAAAIAVVEEQLGPELCNGGRLDHSAQGAFSHREGQPGQFLPDMGEWEIFTRCA